MVSQLTIDQCPDQKKNQQWSFWASSNLMSHGGQTSLERYYPTKIMYIYRLNLKTWGRSLLAEILTWIGEL